MKSCCILQPFCGFDCFFIKLIRLIICGYFSVLNSLGKPGYFLGFYFCLDLVATLSLLGDIPQFVEAITLQDSEGGVGDSTTLARAGRTSRAGTRAGRIARVCQSAQYACDFWKQYYFSRDLYLTYYVNE